MPRHSEKSSINRAREDVDALINGFQATEYNLSVNQIRLLEICSKQGISPQQTEQLSDVFTRCLEDLPALAKFNKNLIALGMELERLDRTLAENQKAA